MRAMSAAWVAYPSHGCGYIPYGSVSNKVSRDPPHCCTIPVGRGRGLKLRKSEQQPWKGAAPSQVSATSVASTHVSHSAYF